MLRHYQSVVVQVFLFVVWNCVVGETSTHVVINTRLTHSHPTTCTVEEYASCFKTFIPLYSLKRVWQGIDSIQVHFTGARNQVREKNFFFLKTIHTVNDFSLVKIEDKHLQLSKLLRFSIFPAYSTKEFPLNYHFLRLFGNILVFIFFYIF